VAERVTHRKPVPSSAMRTSKRILIACLAAPLPGVLSAQEEHATIVGRLDDGRTAPVSPGAPVPPLQVLETKVEQLPDGKLTIHRVANPGLPAPAPPMPAGPSGAPAGAASASLPISPPPVPQEKSQLVPISATLVDGRASLITWSHNGADFEAWSSVDFNYLTVFTGVKKGQTTYEPLVSVGSVLSSARPGDARYRIPQSLKLNEVSFVLTKGDPANQEGIAPIAALHEISRLEGARLHEAWARREQHRMESKAAAAADPAAAKDEVLYYWKVTRPSRRGGSK